VFSSKRAPLWWLAFASSVLHGSGPRNWGTFFLVPCAILGAWRLDKIKSSQVETWTRSALHSTIVVFTRSRADAPKHWICTGAGGFAYKFKVDSKCFTSEESEG